MPGERVSVRSAANGMPRRDAYMRRSTRTRGSTARQVVPEEQAESLEVSWPEMSSAEEGLSTCESLVDVLWRGTLTVRFVGSCLHCDARPERVRKKDDDGTRSDRTCFMLHSSSEQHTE